MISKKIEVVVIDDEKDILEMIEKYLKRQECYNVRTYTNPEVALREISDKADVVLLDIMMPQMNGLDVLSKIMEKDIKAKVIMMTAYSTLDKVLKSHREGATHYIMKPFESLKVLDHKIKEILE